MRAILLAAGLGTRLRPLTLGTPKCLMQIKGVPLLKIWLAKLKDAGFEKVLVNTHYLSEKVEHFLSNEFSDFVEISYEKNLLGTAGTLIHNASFYEGEDVILIHADNYCNLNIKALIHAHSTRPKKCLMTLGTFLTSYPQDCGILEVDKDGVVQKWVEKPLSSMNCLANGAIYALSREILDLIILRGVDNNYSDFVRDMIPMFIGKIYTYFIIDGVIDIGTEERYNEANRES